MLTTVMGVPGLALGISMGRNRPRGQCSADSLLHSSISFLPFSPPPSILATPFFLSVPLLASSSLLEMGRRPGLQLRSPAGAPRGGPGVVRWGRSPNRHLPEEAGRREHPRLASVTHGTRVEGTAGARQAPLPAQPGSRHSHPAVGNGGLAPTAVGAGGGCRVVSNCFQTVFAAPFFKILNMIFFTFYFALESHRLTALCSSPAHGKVTHPYTSAGLCCLKPTCPALGQGSRSRWGRVTAGRRPWGEDDAGTWPPQTLAPWNCNCNCSVHRARRSEAAQGSVLPCPSQV